MLLAAVATADANHVGYLRACLQQTGLVQAVAEWSLSEQGLWSIRPTETMPDVVLLGLQKDFELYFALAAQVRRMKPTVRIIACSPQQPDPQLLLQAMRSGVQEFLPSPVNPQMLHDTLARYLAEREPTGTLPVEKVIVVMGAKGGVGASTVAVNLAVQLAQLGKNRVALLDFARPVGHVCLLLDVRPRFSIRDAAENLERLDGHFFGGLLVKHKSGVEILAGVSHPEEWQHIAISPLARVVNVAQSIFDHVVIDLGSALTPEWNPVLQLARMILLVAEANVPSLWALERNLSTLAALGRDKDRARVIINRWTRKDDEALKTVEKNIKRTIFAKLPNDFQQVSEATNLGTPLARNHNNPLVTQFQRLAGQISGVQVPARAHRGGLGSLFSLHRGK